MKKTKIICTIGPVSDSVEVMEKMVNNGMNCARINLSHATEDGILKTLEVIRDVRKKTGVPVAVMYDTKGPEFRTLKFKSGGVTLKKGDTIRISGNTDDIKKELRPNQSLLKEIGNYSRVVSPVMK